MLFTKEQLLAQYHSNVLPGPLNGVVIVGFCYYVAGPMALQNLVTQGALVIKVERGPLGDPSRYVFSESVFNSLSYGQLSVALDYTNTKDQQLLANLLQLADAIVDNRSIKAKKNDSILQHQLQDPNKLHPQIYCSINGFPDAEVYNEPALDASIQAATGLAHTNCSSPGNPLKVGVALLDQVAGLLAAHYVISNLFFLLKTPTLPDEVKKLIYISVSMAGVSIWLQTGQVINAIEGEEFFRSGNQDRFAVPFSFYTTQNGPISIATVNEDQFKRFCTQVLNDEAFHQHYPTIQIRLEKQEQFERDLNERLKFKTREYWHAQCKKYDIPASPVLTVSEAVQQDFAKKLFSSSTNGKKIITHGVEHSFFKTDKKPFPAPIVDQDRESLSSLSAGNNMLRSKL